MNIFGNLLINEQVEIDQSIIECAARVIQQYAMEDRLLDSSDSDKKLEHLMRATERYLKRYMDVCEAHYNNPSWVANWQHEQSAIFNNHASDYEELYRSVSHMQEAPYFMSQWSICFLIDAALNEHGFTSLDDYLKADRVALSELNYTIRFCENLLQVIHSEFISK